MFEAYRKTFEQAKNTFLNVWLILIGTLVSMNVEGMPNNIESFYKISNIIFLTVISIMVMDRAFDWMKIGNFKRSMKIFFLSLIPLCWLALVFNSIIRKPFISFSIIASYYLFILIASVVAFQFHERLSNLGSEKKQK